MGFYYIHFYLARRRLTNYRAFCYLTINTYWRTARPSIIGIGFLHAGINDNEGDNDKDVNENEDVDDYDDIMMI